MKHEGGRCGMGTTGPGPGNVNAYHGEHERGEETYAEHVHEVITGDGNARHDVPVRIVRTVAEVPRAARSWTAEQISVPLVGTQPAQVIGQHLLRRRLVLENLDAAKNIYLGPRDDVTATNSWVLKPGAVIDWLDTTAAVFAVAEVAGTMLAIAAVTEDGGAQ